MFILTFCFINAVGVTICQDQIRYTTFIKAECVENIQKLTPVVAQKYRGKFWLQCRVMETEKLIGEK